MLKYSIVMPVYNTGKKLNKSIESIINQTYKNWELIVVDDGSTDESPEILQKYSRKDKRIKVFSQINQGPGIARNTGIKKCTGDYIAFIDSDDYYELDFLEQVNEKNKNNMQDIIFIGDVKEYSDGKKFGGYIFEKYEKSSREELIRLQMMGTIPWGGVLKIVKSKIVKECSYSNIKVGEELIYSINVLEKSNNIAFVNKALYHYVHNEKGQHTLGGFDPWKEVAIELKKYMIEKGKYDNYYKEINSLALKALTISLYRYSCKYDFLKARKEYKKIISNYNNEFDIYDINYEKIDKTSKLILMLIKWKFYMIIYCASKVKKIGK